MIDSDAWLSIILLTGWLILVGSGIARRGEPAGKLALQAAIWVGIIGFLWAAVAILQRFIG